MNVIKLNRKPTLVFDSGHGGNDRVNRGHNGWIEADGALLISNKVISFLPKGMFNIVLTRNKDLTMSLTDRVSIAVSNHADLLISHHTNAGGGKGGTEVIYSVDIPNDKQYADALSKGISVNLGIVDRGSKTRESLNYPGEDYFTVIDSAQDKGIPHVFIVEYAFHDVITDEAKLLSDTYLTRACKEEARIICDMFGIAFITPKVSVPVVKTPTSGIVTASTLNVRGSNTTNSPIIGTLKLNDRVKIDKKYGDWYSIYFGDHGGYVSAQYIKTN